MMELGGAEISGIKLHAAIDVLIRRNHIHHNTMGIWLDWEAQGARITQNLLHDNDVPEGSIKLEGGMECMECGSCTYICPARRPLTQAFKEMRKTVAANRRKKG